VGLGLGSISGLTLGLGLVDCLLGLGVRSGVIGEDDNGYETTSGEGVLSGEGEEEGVLSGEKEFEGLRSERRL